MHTARPRATPIPADAFGKDFSDRIRLQPYEGKNLAAANSVLLKRRARGWFVYVDGNLSATFPERFDGPVAIAHDDSLTHLDADGADDAFVQRVAPFRFTDDFLIDPEDQEGKKLGNWDKRQGEWTVHSVEDAVSSEDPRREQRNAQRRNRRGPEAERSPNFYCVEGHGDNALLLTGHDFYDRYTLSAAVHAGEGEYGIVFLATPGGGFHALTATPDPGDGDGLRFSLWQTTTGKPSERRVLASVDTDLLPGQWHRLSVELLDDRIVASVNGIQILSAKSPLSPGGRFGLFTHGPELTRFDDVAASSHEHSLFADVADFRDQLLLLDGKIDRRKGTLPVSMTDELGGVHPAEHFSLQAGSKVPALAVFGSTADSGHALATAVRSGGRPFEAGLVAAWKGIDSTALRFVMRQTEKERIFVLEKATGGLLPEAEIATFTYAAGPSRETHQLLLDATQPDGLLRAYADGRLVLIAPEALDCEGAAGLYVPEGSKVDFALPVHRSERLVHRNKFEKTAAFVTDPYMRHWASPEGEWITLPDGKTWFKGDLFGAVAVHLPWVAPTRLHLAVPEDEENGPLQIVAEGELLRLIASSGEDAPKVLAEAPLDRLAWQAMDAKGTQSNRWYAVNLEDHVLWVRSGDQTLFSHTLPERLPGRRMRVEGLSVENLGHSRVERTGIVDFLFTESLYEWTLNGGRWEVVNRFQCDPRWSHLNGESAASLAALWSRYKFEGDFSAELYAGMRHGWYERPGDLNLTVLGSSDSPASGYTFVCTGWDPDESQRLSRLFRNGALVAETEQYLVPRIREGSVRRGYNPLVASGRDVHGAWYYTQMRRVGSELQVSFDHEPVFAVQDAEPLQAGGLGIWTYRNSMVVARVKMAAEKIRPRRFAIAPVAEASRPAKPSSAVPWPAECAAPVLAVATAAKLTPENLEASQHNPRYPALPGTIAVPATTNGIPLAYWTPDVWSAQDAVSHPRLDWLPTEGAPDRFLMTARQAGGTFFASNSLPAMPVRLLAGWRFEVARTEDAQFNFHYTVGRMATEGFQPARALFHQLSGSDESRGPALRTGGSDVPAAPSGKPAIDGPWHTVEVWLPAFPREEDSLWVRVEGFGNLQPSDVQQGLTGNRPGAAYAVRNFAPLLMDAPVLDSKGADPAAAAAFQQKVAERNTAAIHALPLPQESFPLAASAHWVVQPANLALSASWSEERHDVVEIRSDMAWPVRALKGLPATVNGTEATVIPREGNRLHVLIPRTLEAPANGIYQVDLATSARRPVGWGLPVSARTAKAAPVLKGLNSDLFRLENFEERASVPAGAVGGTVRHADERQGSYLRTSNAGQLRRLATPLAGETDLARNPVVQLRYRGEPMARVSLRMDRLGDVAFTETPPYGARIVRGSNPGLQEDDWATWTGILSDGIPEQPLRLDSFLKTASLALQSCHRFDQTGRYTMLSVDDIVAGPAVGPHRPLTLTPTLLDLDRDGFVEWAVAQEAAPTTSGAGDASSESAVLAWTRAEAGKPVEIPLADLAEGLHQVHFRPASPRAKGPVTSFPILVDRTPIGITSAVEQTPGTGNGTTLVLRLALNGGSPPRLETLRATCADREVNWFNGPTRIAIAEDAATLRVNWPLLLRRQIQDSTDGDTLELQIEGIADGAENRGEPHTVSLPIRYAEDTTPPTLMPTDLPTNIAWRVSWADRDSYQSAFRARVQCSVRAVVGDKDSEPAMQINVAGNASTITETLQKPWDPAAFPVLALRAGFAKLPAKTTEATLRLGLQYQPKGGKVQNLHQDLFLTQAKLPSEITGKVNWNEGGVSELQIDMPALLRRLLDGYAGELGTITGLQLAFVNASGAIVQLHDAAICAPWGKDDELTVRAYDASGIKGLAWQNGGETEDMKLTPAALALPGDDAAWLRLKVRDRAGNETPVMQIPLPKPSAAAPPAEEATPPAEEATPAP